jgi:hypothetical protein
MRADLSAHLTVSTQRVLAAVETSLCPALHAHHRRTEVLHEATLYVNSPELFPHPPASLRVTLGHLRAHAAGALAGGAAMAAGAMLIGMEGFGRGQVAGAVVQVSVACMVLRFSWHLTSARRLTVETCPAFSGVWPGPSRRLRCDACGLAALLLLALVVYPSAHTSWDLPIIAGHALAAVGLLAVAAPSSYQRTRLAFGVVSLGAAAVALGDGAFALLTGPAAARFGSALASVGAALYCVSSLALGRRKQGPPPPLIRKLEQSPSAAA